VRALLLAALVGAIGGLLGVAFRAAADAVQALVVGSGSLLEGARALPWWRRLLTPAAGALAAGLLVHVAARRDTAFGIGGLMEAVTFRRRPIRTGPTLARIGAALATIGSGGSVGREGPIIQLGATAANLLGRAARCDARSLSILLAAGAASGMAAAYNAPLAGALFVMEAMLANFAMDVFASVAVASGAGTLVMRAILGGEQVYDVEIPMGGGAPSIVLAALPLGVLCGGAAVLFQRLLQRATELFGRLRLHRAFVPALGGLLVGAIGLLWPEVWGNGFPIVSDILQWRIPLFDPGQALAASVVVLLVMKPVATACSVGSGGQGGVFTPALFLGAALGALCAAAADRLPGVDLPRAALSIVGMGGLLAGITHAPIAAAALLFEMTHQPGLLLPLAACAAASALTAKLVARDSLYTESLRRRGVPVDAGIEELALRQLRVGDLLEREVALVEPKTPLSAVVERFERDNLDLLYVVDERRVLRGVVTLHDVKTFFNRRDAAAGRIVIAADVMRRAPQLDPDASLAEVLELFDLPEFDELPVARADGVLLGRVTRRDLVATLHLEVLGRPSARAKFVIEGAERPRYLELPSGFELARVPVTKSLAGRRLGDTGLRRNHRLVVLAVVRADPEIGEQRLAFDPDLVLEEGETLVVMGRHDDIAPLRQPA
jgi:CIC family chloride channel protein